MRKRLSSIVLVLMFSLFTSLVYGQTTHMGGRGLMRVFAANTIKPGVFLGHFGSHAYLFTGGGGPLGKDITTSAGLTYGLSNSIELTAHIVSYQDDQGGAWAPPGDTQLGFKWQVPSGGSVLTGLRGYLSIPTASNHNVAFEPYSTDKLSWGLMGLVTLDLTNSFPLFPVKAHWNVGYLDHDASTFFSNTINDQVQFGLGLQFLVRSVVLYTEYTAEIFHSNDAINFGSNSMRLTQGARFPWILDLVFDLGVDIGLHSQAGGAAAPLHEYADWKVLIGATYNFSAKKGPRRTGLSEKDLELDKDMIEEIKLKREKAAKELEEMRKKLQEDEKASAKKKDKKKNDITKNNAN